MKNQFPPQDHWVYKYRPRLKDWRFWVIQVLAVGIAITHSLFESQGYFSELGRLYFIPIILLVVPVIIAALIFGSAGSVSTALWVIAISIPSLIFDHTGFERYGELFQMGTLLAIAIFMGDRVDKERSLRYKVEAIDTALRSSEAKYLNLFDSSPIAILLLDKNDTIVDANPAAGFILNKPPTVLKGTDMSQIEVKKMPDSPAAPQQNRWWEANLVVKPINGSETFLRPTCTQVTDNQGQTLTQVMLRDVTEEYYRQAGLKAYTAHIIRAQEEERLHIARELHDETIQNLSLLCRQLDNVRSSEENLSPSAVEDLQETQKIAEKTVKELRDFTKGLRPPSLDDLGMVASIRRLLVDFMDRTKISGQFQIIGAEKRLAEDIEVGMFRIAQEALWNVEHHAKATNVDITVYFDKSYIKLRVSDNGVGFNVPPVLGGLTAKSHLGLVGMQERTELFGGKLDIQSSPGKGTIIDVTIPIF